VPTLIERGQCEALPSYLVDVQFTLLVVVSLAVNLIFFAIHPIFTSYYIIPIDMISLWTRCSQRRLARGQAVIPQPANA